MIVQSHTHAKLLALVDDRVHRLKSAGGLFDEGQLVEARQMAVDIRGLVHHTEKSPALIHQLGVHRDLTWVDTAGVAHPMTATSAACLTLMKIGSGPRGRGEYIPKLELYPPAPIRTRDGGSIDRGSRIPIDHWWTNPVVKDPDGTEYSRKQLVLALANHGAHTQDDADTKAAHHAVVGSRWLGWAVSGGIDSASANLAANPLMASVRQIGYEVVQTIRQQRDIVEGACAAAVVSLPTHSTPIQKAS